MRKDVGLVAAMLLVTGGCGDGGGIETNPGPFSVSLLQRVRVVGVPRSGGAELAAFALGRTDPGTTPDLFLVPTDGYPGCAVVSGPGFSPNPVIYGWGGYTNAHSVAVADFVEDGRANDAVVTSLAAGSGQTWIMGALPNENNAYLYPNPWHEVQTGLATRLVAGDWDDDDHLDLAILEPLSAQVRVLFGDGAGNFASVRDPSTFDVGIAPTALLTADFNDDLRPDLAIASAFSGTVTILLGAVDGGFSTAPPVTGVPGVLYLTSTDLDGDGHLDLALSSNTDDEVAIVRGNGDGTFTAPTFVSLPANSAPTGIAAADLDGDGDIDLVVGLTDDNDIAVILNDGNGGMTLPQFFRYSLGAGGGLPRQVEVGDLEGDGDLDVFVLIDRHVVVFEQT